MNYIYHEKQEGSLCGQHCLNNLLQGQFFSAVELAEIAQQMDSEEQQRMAELGTHTDDFRQFLEQPSSNMDDSGMFSVQVLTTALKVWDLSLVPYASSSPLAASARTNPTEKQAYICNFKEHWFTVRKLGRQWFNLNSLLTFPELISDTYLSLFLTQLQHEGYAIFVLDGQLPPCEADDALKVYPAVQTIKPQLLSEVESLQSKEDLDLKAALAASLAKAGVESGLPKGYPIESTSSDDDLRAAIQLSLEQSKHKTDSQKFEGSSDDDDFQRAIRLSLEAAGSSGVSSALRSNASKKQFEEEDHEEDMEKALQMSLNSSLCAVQVPENPLEPDVEELRKKRLAKLDSKRAP